MEHDQAPSRPGIRRRVLLGILAAVLVLPGCTAAGAARVGTVPATAGSVHASLPSRPAAPVREAALPEAPKPPAPPRFLTVEGTSIAVDIVPVGVRADQAMQIPDSFGQAGWYRFGAAPGAKHGTAVIAAHVDTLTDLAPFSQLQHVRRGAAITVQRRGAPPLVYRVLDVAFVDKDRFDTRALFRRDGPHQLRLVTCGGKWLDDRQDYSDNVVVTARPE
ncbi:class F sortase [Arthrobacter sp. GCM10027362]|uniref:class F sortase n=1 Tax=Arthrobacter sp. GCM10027362 TaxID=3273379 RepID=UPI00363117B4